MMAAENPKSVFDTLDKIREGGSALVAVTLQRIEETTRHLTEGDFAGAYRRLEEARIYLSHLANAQNAIAIHGEGVSIVRASDIQPGMQLLQVGEVQEVSESQCQACSHPAHGQRGHVTVELRFTDEDFEPWRLPAEQEVFITTEAPPPPQGGFEIFRLG
jgi:hypothetical protein